MPTETRACCSLLLIRHAQTGMAGRFCGQIDPPLNNEGCAQLPKMIELLNHFALDALFTSDLLRTRQTAAAIAQAFHLEPQQDVGLREISFGRWEGLSWDEISAQDEKEASRWATEYPHRAAPGGESFAIFSERITRTLNRLAHRHTGQQIAVVTHGGVIRAALLKATGAPLAELGTLACEYTSVHRLQITEEQWQTS